MNRLDSLLTSYPNDKEVKRAWYALGGQPRNHPKAGATQNSPAGYALDEAYPNPFNGFTMIRFTIPSEQTVNLIVTDALGRQVAVLADGEYQQGTHMARFDAADLTAGLYFYTMKAGTYSMTKKMILTK